MASLEKAFGKTLVMLTLLALLLLEAISAAAQQAVQPDPMEPAKGKPQPKIQSLQISSFPPIADELTENNPPAELHR